MYYFILLFLFIRPVLDIFSEKNIAGLNIASFFSVLICIGTFFKFVKLSGRIDKLAFEIKALGVFLLFLLPSVLYSCNYIDSMTNLLKYLTILSVAYWVRKYVKVYRKRIAIEKSIIYSFVISSVFGVYQFVTKTGTWDKDVGNYRLCSFFTHPNQYAFYLVVIFGFLYLLLKYEPIIKKWQILILMVLDVFLLIFTYSRSGWIWLAFIALAMVLSNNMKKFIMAVLSIIIVLFLARPLIAERFADVSNGIAGSSMGSRVLIWTVALSKLPKFNLTGMGLGTFMEFSALPAHNEYINSYFESGLVGLFGIIVYTIKMLWGSLKRYGTFNVITFMLIGFFVIAFVSNIFDSLVSQVYFFSFLMIAEEIITSDMLDGQHNKTNGVYYG